MSNTINNIFSNYKPYINGWENFKRASVTIPIVNYNDEPHILFEIRAKTLRSQPSEICFPGGKIEKDEHPLDTAIRETCEEMGVCENDINIISPLDLFISPFDILIHPYLITINNLNNLSINSTEVEKVFLVPLQYLLNHKPTKYINKVNITPHDNFPYDLIPSKQDYKFKTGSYEILFYTYNEYVIWGLTAKILFNFLSILKQSNYQV